MKDGRGGHEKKIWAGIGEGENVQLALAAFEVHVANLSEDRALSPSLVVHAADAPHAARVPCA